ncbi:MAG: hypothetical protein ACI88C_001824 [Acidimicrobiales bacterium]|jgi:hypothetical protein
MRTLQATECWAPRTLRCVPEELPTLAMRTSAERRSLAMSCRAPTPEAKQPNTTLELGVEQEAGDRTDDQEEHGGLGCGFGHAVEEPE